MIVKYGSKDKSLSLNKGEVFRGDDGGYYIPSVDDEGNLSWTPTEENMETPLEVNIRGPQGEPGMDGNDNVYVGTEEPSSEHLIWINPEEELDNEGFATKEYVDKAIAQAQLEGEEVDLNGYYTKTEVDNKIEQIELTPGPAGKDGQDGKDYVLTEADKQEIASMVEVSGDGTDLTNYYTKSEVDNKIPDVSDYQTADDVTAAINSALNAIGIAEEGTF